MARRGCGRRNGNRILSSSLVAAGLALVGKRLRPTFLPAAGSEASSPSRLPRKKESQQQGGPVSSAGCKQTRGHKRHSGVGRHGKSSLSLGMALTAAAGTTAAMMDSHRTLRKLSGWTQSGTVNTHHGNVSTEADELQAHAAQLRAEAATLENMLASDRMLRLWREWHNAAGESEMAALTPAALQRAAPEMIGMSITLLEAQRLVELHDSDGSGNMDRSDFATAHVALRDDLVAMRKLARPSCAEDEDQKDDDPRERPVVAVAATGDGVAKFQNMPEEVIDTQPGVRMLALLPFIIPLLDAGRMMAPAETEAMLGSVALDIFEVVQPLLMVALSSFGCRWSLPQLLRFSLFQAFTMSLVILTAQLFLSSDGWLNLPSLGIGNLEFLESTNLVCLLMSVLGIVYSCTAVLSGDLPDKLPVVSAAARAALGRIHRPNRDPPADEKQEEADEEPFWSQPAPRFLLCLVASLLYVGLLSSYWALVASLLWQYQGCQSGLLASEAWPYAMTIPFP